MDNFTKEEKIVIRLALLFHKELLGEMINFKLIDEKRRKELVEELFSATTALNKMYELE